MNSHKALRGFTLVELMISVAILGIIASIAIPSFTGLVAAQRVKSTATDVMMSLLLARSEAIKRNKDATVEAAGGDWSKGWSVQSGGQTISSSEASSLDISGPSSVTYLSSGRISDASVEIEISSDQASISRCVTVSLSGRPMVKDTPC